jgi:hypothetical protein
MPARPRSPTRPPVSTSILNGAAAPISCGIRLRALVWSAYLLQFCSVSGTGTGADGTDTYGISDTGKVMF